MKHDRQGQKVARRVARQRHPQGHLPVQDPERSFELHGRPAPGRRHFATLRHTHGMAGKGGAR